MNVTVTKAALAVIYVIAGLTLASLLTGAALIVAAGLPAEQVVLFLALIVNGPTMGLLGILARTSPTPEMLDAARQVEVARVGHAGNPPGA